MSLKAKLEAVIYAAEEPVTLNQLAALFAADALEWKAAQEAAAAEQTAEMAGVSPDAIQPLPLIELVAEATLPADASLPGEPATESRQTEAGGEGERTPGIANPDSATPPSNEVISVGEGAAYPSIVVEGEMVSPPSEPVNPGAEIDPEVEARRIGRQRDKEIKGVLKQLLDELMASYQADGRGVEIREIAGGYRMATKPECHDAVRMFVKSLKPALKLSLPALETLAVIAYKQPVTAPEVNEIRGVESAGVLGSLLARKLIATAGRKPVIGRPILYKTTKEFLLRFGLKDVSELPSMEEFEKMAASELELEPEVVEADEATAAMERAEAGEPVIAGVPEENAEANLESNSPSGEEMAGAAAEEETNAAVEDEGKSTGGAAGVSLSHSTEESTEPATIEPGAEQETEATTDAKESDQQIEKEE
jgi:segregation and condensation protein B